MPGAKYGIVFEVAADHFGYVTVEQAREACLARLEALLTRSDRLAGQTET